MKRYWILSLSLIVALLLPGIAASGQDENENHVLRLLHYLPDTPEVKGNVIYFGDLAAWHESWNVPRIFSMEELDKLPIRQQWDWIHYSGTQTWPLDLLYHDQLQGNIRSLFGFDLFMIDRFIRYYSSSDIFDMAESQFLEAEVITDLLIKAAYNSSQLADDWTLYSYLDESDTNPAIRRYNFLHQIALRNEQMLFAIEKNDIMAAVDASSNSTSLADNLVYAAGALALTDPALDDTGELIGAIFINGNSFYGVPSLQPDSDGLLASFDLAVLGTRHSAKHGATFLVLAVVFPEDVDAQTAAETLGVRLSNYKFPAGGYSMPEEGWGVDQILSTEINGKPVALAVMRTTDVPPVPGKGPWYGFPMISWYHIFTAGDFSFLVPNSVEESDQHVD